MVSHTEGFKPPKVRIVIADDEDKWGELLQGFFSDRMKKWAFHRTGQFLFTPHRCESAETLMQTVNGLLEEGDLVYATFDLKMPFSKGTVPDGSVGEKILRWGLDRQRSLGDSRRFEFCVISNQEGALDDLYKNSKYGPELEKEAVKRIYKSQIEESADVALLKIWEDIRSFVLRHMRFCIVSDREQSEKTMVWFSGHESLVRLLALTDEIAARPDKSDFRVIFAETCGYEEDWFRLCCHLRGVDDPTVHRFGELNRKDPSWRKQLKEPQKGVLVSHPERAHARDIDVYEEIRQSGFLDAIGNNGTFVCFQFPNLETELDLRFGEKGVRSLLEACLSKIYRHGPPFEPGVGFPYKDDPRLVRFPSYEALKNAGAIRATIKFQVAQCIAQHPGVGAVPLDPEVEAVLAEIRWSGREELDSLRIEIRHAYKTADSQMPRVRRYIEIDCFSENSAVQTHFASRAGFVIRGRRLTDLLDHPWTRHQGGTSSSQLKDVRFSAAISGLQDIYDLFASLQQLVDLSQKLEHQEGSIEFPEDFPVSDFEALKDALLFLQSIFKSPEALAERIAEFWRFAKDKNWRAAYPSFEFRDDWREVIEHVRFTWPNSRFRLPAPLDDYLRWSGVVADIYREMDRVLPRYPDLAEKWRANEAARRTIEEEVQDCEIQRRAAERYARDEHSQPVLAILGQPDDEDTSTLQTTLQALLLFNAHVALCENVVHFQGAFAVKNDAKELLTRPSLGYSIQFLRNYLKRVQQADKKSILQRWTHAWPKEGDPHGARVVSALIGKVLDNKEFLKSLSAARLNSLTTLEKSNSESSVWSILDFLAFTRNTFEKQNQEDLLRIHRGDIRDLLRQLVRATTVPTFRFGQVTNDGKSARLWLREDVEEAAIAKEAASYAGKTCVFLGSPYHPHFPIDDLIRFYPEEQHRVVAYFGSGGWIDLVRGTVLVKGEQVPYLPDAAETRKSAVWSWVHE